MGQLPVNYSSKQIAKGYAVLTNFEATGVANVCHLPDPVCARLAMLIMQNNKKIGSIVSQSPSFWTNKMGDLFSHGLCHPSSGDAGEVFAAFYMLLCADQLRFKQGDDKLFSVSLSDWVELLLNGGTVKDEDSSHKQQENSGQFKEKEKDSSHEPKKKKIKISNEKQVPTIGFLQVCRCYLRFPNLEGWTGQKFLKYIYTLRVALYAYPGCAVYDIFGFIRVDKKYVPMLVSVKARANFTPLEARSACSAMTNLLEEAKLDSGLCIVLLLGLKQSEHSKFSNDLLNQ